MNCWASVGCPYGTHARREATGRPPTAHAEGKIVRHLAAADLGKVKGLNWTEFPQDGKRLPLRLGPMRNTLLTAGDPASAALFNRRTQSPCPKRTNMRYVFSV